MRRAMLLKNERSAQTLHRASALIRAKARGEVTPHSGAPVSPIVRKSRRLARNSTAHCAPIESSFRTHQFHGDQELTVRQCLAGVTCLARAFGSARKISMCRQAVPDRPRPNVRDAVVPSCEFPQIGQAGAGVLISGHIGFRRCYRLVEPSHSDRSARISRCRQIRSSTASRASA